MSQQKYKLLRKLLSALGLSAERVDELIVLIQGWLSEDGGASNSDHLPYKLRSDFLTPTEAGFYRILEDVTSGWAILHTKVNLADIFYPAIKDRRERQIYRNKIDRKHVDFLLCDPKSLEPILGIELDDKSHQRKDRIARDKFVDAVFAAAELPIAHIPVATAYDHPKLQKYLMKLAKMSPSHMIGVVAEKDSQVQDKQIPHGGKLGTDNESSEKICPVCSGVMVLREAKRGPNKGNKFLGCSNYPKCRKVLPVGAVDQSV